MRIGDLAERTGASVRSLRYYEQQRLLSSTRTAGGQRVYGDDAVDRVRLLRRLYGAGLNSATIASIMPCVDTPSRAVTASTLEVMRHQHARLGEQITDLVTTREQLAHLIDAALDHHREQVDDAAFSAST